MSSTDDQQPTSSTWNDEAKAAFNEFKKRRRTLPSPSNVALDPDNNSKKPKRNPILSDVRNSGVTNRRILFDNNRNLGSNLFDLAENKNSSMRNSTLNENYQSMELSVADELNQTEVSCDDFEMKLADVQSMIKNKDDPYSIIEKLVNSLADAHKINLNLIQKIGQENLSRCQRLNEQHVSMENELLEKINYIHQRNEERINALEVSQRCKSECNVLWINFADPQEIASLKLKPKNELIIETRKIFKRMDIWLNDPLRTIVDVFIQKVALKTDRGFDRELILGVKFLCSKAVKDIKYLIMNYAKNNFMSKNYDAIRYTARDNWTIDIWKLLRVCFDLVNFKLLERAQVTEIGIAVYFKNNPPASTVPEDNSSRMLIRNETDLNILRSAVNDVAPDIPTFQIYDSSYFKLNQAERKEYKDKLSSSQELFKETNNEIARSNDINTN